MSLIANGSGASGANRAIENLIGADILSSGLGGMSGDPAAAKLASLLPLDMVLDPAADAASTTAAPSSTPWAATTATDLLGSAALPGLLHDATTSSFGTFFNRVSERVENSVGTVGDLLSGSKAHDGTVLGNVVGLVAGDDPHSSADDAVGKLGETVSHVGSAAANTVARVGDIGDTPLITVLNGTITDFHADLSNAGDSLGLGNTLQGVISVGTTTGFGKIGRENVVTDVLDLPDDLLGGGSIDLGGTLNNVGNVVKVLPDPVTGLIEDVGAALGYPMGTGPLQGAIDTVDGLGDTIGGLLQGNGPLQPVAGVVDDLLGGGLGDPAGGGLVDTVTDTLGGLTGGATGGLLQPVTDTVDDLLGGGLGDPAGGGLVDTVTDTVGGLTGDAGGGLLQPVTDTVDDLLGSGLGDPAGGGLIETVTDTVGGLTGGAGGGLLEPVTDTVDDLLGGGLGGDPVGGGLIETVTDTVGGLTGDAGGGLFQPVTDTVDDLLGGGLGGDPAGGLIEAVTDTLGGLTGGDTLPLPAPGGGLDGLTGLLGDVTDTVSGAIPEGGLVNLDLDVVLGGCGCEPAADQQPSSHLLDGLGLAA